MIGIAIKNVKKFIRIKEINKKYVLYLMTETL
jgi:hypothetical protein